MAEQRTLDAERAELYPKAVAIVKEQKRASVSLVQRRLRLSWDTARDLVELMLERKDVPLEWAPQVYQLAARRAPPALDAEGLPALPLPAARMYVQNGYRRASVLPGKGEPLYAAEQVRQAQRDAVAADRRSRVSADQWASLEAARLQVEAARIERENRQDRLARTSAPEGAPVGMEGSTVSVDVSTGDEDAGNRIFAELTGETGSDGTTLIAIETSRNFAAPTSASAQPEVSVTNYGNPVDKSASAQPAEDVDKPTLATLLEAAGARRVVICHDGSGKPFDAYDKPIADRVVGQLSLRLTKLRMALQEISEIRYGYEPDSSATGIANDALFTDDEEAK